MEYSYGCQEKYGKWGGGKSGRSVFLSACQPGQPLVFYTLIDRQQYGIVFKLYGFWVIIHELAKTANFSISER